MAALPEATGALPQTEGEEVKDGVEVCVFDESPEVFSRAVHAISELTAGEPEPNFPDAEVERLASSITFLREWRHLSYEPKNVSFTCDARSAPSRVDTHKINLPQFSSASVPQITHLDDGKAKTDNFVIFAGGNVWALDWCPRLCDRPHSPINCEYLAVAAHPPGSSYHKIGMPLIGRGIIQVWCLLAPSEEGHPHQSLVACNKYNPSNQPKRRGRPRKTITNSDHLEPSVKRPRGRPRKYPLPIAKLEDSSQNDTSQEFALIDPLVSSAVVSCDVAIACPMPTVNPVESTPRKGRGRPRKKPVEIKGLSGIKLTEDLSTALSPIALTCMEPKKKRGRPRKYPAPSNSKHLPGTDTELGNDSVCLLPGSIDCGLGPTENTGSGANITHAAVDAASPVPLSGQRGREQPEKEVIHIDNSMQSGQSDVGSMLPTYILPESSNKSNSTGPRRRGRPRKKPFPSTTSCVFAPGTETPKKGSTLTNSNNLMVLAKSNCDILANDIGRSSCAIENSVHLSVGTSRVATPAQGICLAKCKEESSAKKGRGRPRKQPISTERGCSKACRGEEQKTQTIPKSSDNAALVENCKKESCPGKGSVQDKKKSVSNERSSVVLSVEVQNMDGSSASTAYTSCCTPACNFENAERNQAVSVPSENSAQVIDELKDTEVARFKESTKDYHMICSAEKTLSRVPKDISLPRVVLCLAHNGKVAWDIKWKPPSANQSEHKSCLGFLAVLLGNGSLEVWEVPSPSMIQKIYSSSSKEGTDPRFLKLKPVFSSAKVALWKFSANLSFQGSKPFMCVTAESAPIRTVSWTPSVSKENMNAFVTAGEDGLKFWDLRDPYRHLWELTTARRAVISLQWLKDARGIVISLEDGTLKFVSLSRIANDVPVTGRPFVGMKTQGVSTYQLSEYLIWSVHASEIAGAFHLMSNHSISMSSIGISLTPRFWEKEPGRNRVPYFLCGSLSEEGTTIKIGQETGAIVLAAPSMQENFGTSTSRGSESPENFEVFPPKAVALHRLRWNMNKGSEKWLCYGGAAGIIRSGNVTRSVSKPHGRNLFLQSLVEEGQNPSTSNGASNSQKSVEDKDLIDCLENGVNFWTDYSKVQYHPQSLYELHGSWTDFDKFDNYGSAQEVVSDWSQIEEMNERLRFFVEECDHIQGIQFIVGDSGSFSSVAAQFLENIADDYTNTPVLLYCVRDPMTLGSSRMNQRESIMRALHDAVSFSKLSSFCNLMVPIGPPSLSRSYMSSYLYIQDEKPFHASAVCAAAIHSITVPFRLQRTGPSSDLAHSSGNLDIGELLHILSDQGRQNMIEMLLGNIEMKLHSLTPEISDEDEDPYSVESLVDFHITSERLVYEARETKPKFSHLSASLCPLPVPLPFPSIFRGNIGRHGEILSDHAEESQPKGSLNIESIPMAARLRSSSAVLPFIERRSGSLQKHGVARGAIGSLVLRDWGFGREEVDDMGEHLAKLLRPFHPEMDLTSDSD
uniref:DML1/Misato tubulin domain-containing protein n=1 Tax=Oryza rufipogon TaxID=4529 RepID=A0A0E0Q7Q7_ORYRU